jgi:hypothetical protein
MNCGEAAEFVSALCDGETIPRAAAEHIGECKVCHAQLTEYVEMGAELRRVASLRPMEEARVLAWEKDKRARLSSWWKGWETMRIPRLVFGLLLVAIATLGSSLAIVKARVHSHGAVLMLTAKTVDGKTVSCALSLEDKNSARCASMVFDRIYGFRVVSNDGEQVELGVRMGLAAGVGAISPENVDKLPEKQYLLQPSEKL